MEGLIMNYPLTTNTILEYGNSVYHHKKIITYLPDGTRHEYRFGDMCKRCKKLANALIHKLGIYKGDMVGKQLATRVGTNPLNKILVLTQGSYLCNLLRSGLLKTLI